MGGGRGGVQTMHRGGGRGGVQTAVCTGEEVG
jgi:hypothetical protein